MSTEQQQEPKARRPKGIGLGPNLFYGTSLAACILVLRLKKKKERKKKVLILDASREFKTGRAQNELLPEHVEHIFSWYRDYKDADSIAKVVTLDDICANDYNLNITRYVERKSEDKSALLIAEQSCKLPGQTKLSANIRLSNW